VGRFIYFFSILLVLGAVGLAMAAFPLQVYDVNSKQVVLLDRRIEKMHTADALFLGAEKGSRQDESARLAVLRAVERLDGSCAVGLEMIQHEDQAALDDFLAGTLSEAEFSQIYYRSWDASWEVVRDAFLYCRERKIPMLALGAPRDIIEKVRRGGFDALTSEDLDRLPSVSCKIDRVYQDFLREQFGNALKGSEFVNFCEARYVWDNTMAVYAAQYIKKHKPGTMIVWTDLVSAWKASVPARLAENTSRISALVVQPEVPGRLVRAGVLPDDCDYLLLSR
jgi:uncharacterized iron-regulated protein